MIYTDGVHLVADSLEELHTFAKEIGLKPSWFQAHKKHPHYDLTTPRASKRAQENGAIKVSRYRIVQVSRLLRRNSLLRVAKKKCEHARKENEPLVVHVCSCGRILKFYEPSKAPTQPEGITCPNCHKNYTLTIMDDHLELLP